MISVCMATYNGGKYLREQIESILPQLGQDDELIISDDGSIDKTIEILESYNDKRLKIFHNKINHGVNNNFENALNQAKGEYIFLADQDDVWIKDKVKTCIAFLQNNDCIVHDCYITDNNLKILSQSLFSELKVRKGIINNIIRNGFTGCCMAFKRDILKKILPFPKNNSFYHDQWIGLNATLYYKTEFINRQLILFRRHSNSSSTAGLKSTHSFTHRIKYRTALCKNLILNHLKTTT